MAVDAARHLGRPRALSARPTGPTSAGRYFAGDGAKRDDDGYFWLLGRVDDVMNVVRSPHLDHRGRVRAGRPPDGRRGGRGRRQDDVTGQAIVAVRDAARRRCRRTVDAELREHVAQEIGAIAQPKTIYLHAGPAQDALAARSCAACCATSPRAATLGDTTTLADASVVEELQAKAAASADD